MAYAGQTISNPITAEQITFLATTEDTRGERLVFDCRVGLDGRPLPPHIHATQDEHLEVFAGTVGVMLGGRIYTLQAGQSLTLPTKIKHQWWNAGRDELYMRVEVVPPRHLEAVLEAVSGMAHDGKLRGNGMPKNPITLANLLRLSETFTPGVPIWMQHITLMIAASVGRLLGYDPAFTQYQTGPREPVHVGGDRHDAA